MDLVKTPVSIDEFVSALDQFPASTFDETPVIDRFLREHQVRPDTLGSYLCWDRQHYTRNLLHRTPFFELIAICWEIGQQSSIHNHDRQNCWMAVPIGRLLVQNYRAIDEDLAAGRCQIQPTDLVEMNDANPLAVNPLQPVHKVFNPREFAQRAVSLHIYSLPFNQCVVYSEEQGTCGIIKLSYTTEFGIVV